MLSFVHERLSDTTLYFMVALGVWGLWNVLRGAAMTPSYWGGVAVGQVLIMFQAVIGVLLMVLGAWPARGLLHLLYGVATVVALPSAFAFTRGRSSRYEALIYAVVALFLAGMTVRARQTGGWF